MQIKLKHFLLFGAVLGLMSCKPPGTSEIQVQAIGPFKVGSHAIDFKVSSPLSTARLDLEGNMNMSGMKPAFGSARLISEGLYRSENLVFDMAGDWILTVKANEKGKVLTSQLPILVK
jgi:hypothetical protein